MSRFQFNAIGQATISGCLYLAVFGVPGWVNGTQLPVSTSHVSRLLDHVVRADAVVPPSGESQEVGLRTIGLNLFAMAVRTGVAKAQVFALNC